MTPIIFADIVILVDRISIVREGIWIVTLMVRMALAGTLNGIIIVIVWRRSILILRSVWDVRVRSVFLNKILRIRLPTIPVRVILHIYFAQ